MHLFKSKNITIQGNRVDIIVFSEGVQSLLDVLNKIPNNYANYRSLVFAHCKHGDYQKNCEKFISDFFIFLIEATEKVIKQMQKNIAWPTLIKIEVLPNMSNTFMADTTEKRYFPIAVCFSYENLIYFIRKKSSYFSSRIGHEIVHCIDEITPGVEKILRKWPTEHAAPFFLMYTLFQFIGEILPKFRDMLHHERLPNGRVPIPRFEDVQNFRRAFRKIHRYYYSSNPNSLKEIDEYFDQARYLLCWFLPLCIGLSKMVKRNIGFSFYVHDKKILFHKGLLGSNFNKMLPHITAVDPLLKEIYEETFREINKMSHIKLLKAYDHACSVLGISRNNQILSYHDYKRSKAACYHAWKRMEKYQENGK